MKKIFHKFAFLYIIIFLVTFMILMIGVRSFISRYFVQNEIDQITRRINNYEQVVNRRFINTISLNLLQEQIILLDGYTGANIWLFTKEGHLYATESSLEMVDIENNLLLKKDIADVFAGNQVHRQVDDKKIYNYQTLRIGYPFNVGDVQYAMFINVPMPEIEDMVSRVSVIIFISLSLSGLLAVGLIFLVTKQMGKEINVLNQAAYYIAQGNFDKKIIVNRKDELGELAKNFNKMADELNLQEETKRMFISSLSHDLRTPLTNIKGYTRGMLDGTIERDKSDRYLKIVLNESDRLIKMINDLLDLSKMESGALVLEKTDFSLNDVIFDVLDNFEQKIIEKDVKLHLDLSKENILAHADESNIQRVIFNLLDNATKFVNPSGSIHIRTELKNDLYYVGISNTGAVLSPKELQLMWERFNKLDPSRGLEKKSSGLGLAIVREIIKAHNESIEVYSNEDVGVAFIFTVSAQFFK